MFGSKNSDIALIEKIEKLSKEIGILEAVNQGNLSKIREQEHSIRRLEGDVYVLESTQKTILDSTKLLGIDLTLTLNPDERNFAIRGLNMLGGYLKPVLRNLEIPSYELASEAPELAAIMKSCPNDEQYYYVRQVADSLFQHNKK